MKNYITKIMATIYFALMTSAMANAGALTIFDTIGAVCPPNLVQYGTDCFAKCKPDYWQTTFGPSFPGGDCIHSYCPAGYTMGAAGLNCWRTLPPAYIRKFTDFICPAGKSDNPPFGCWDSCKNNYNLFWGIDKGAFCMESCKSGYDSDNVFRACDRPEESHWEWRQTDWWPHFWYPVKIVTQTHDRYNRNVYDIPQNSNAPKDQCPDGSEKGVFGCYEKCNKGYTVNAVNMCQPTCNEPGEIDIMGIWCVKPKASYPNPSTQSVCWTEEN